jgi:hypothetical protein
LKDEVVKYLSDVKTETHLSDEQLANVHDNKQTISDAVYAMCNEYSPSLALCTVLKATYDKNYDNINIFDPAVTGQFSDDVMETVREFAKYYHDLSQPDEQTRDGQATNTEIDNLSTGPIPTPPTETGENGPAAEETGANGETGQNGPVETASGQQEPPVGTETGAEQATTGAEQPTGTGEQPAGPETTTAEPFVPVESTGVEASTGKSEASTGEKKPETITEYGVEVVVSEYKDPFTDKNDDNVAVDVEKFYDILFKIVQEKHKNPLADFQADYQGFLVDFSADCYSLAIDLKFEAKLLCEDLVLLLETTFRSQDVFTEGHDEDFLSQVDEEVVEYRQDYGGFAEYQSEYQSEIHSVSSKYLAHDRVDVDMDLMMNFQLVAGDQTDLHLFVKAFIAATSKTLGVTDARISVLDVLPGNPQGVHVEFAILADPADENVHSDSSNPSSVDALADKFVAMAKDKDSALYSSAFLSRIDLSKDIKLTKELGSESSGSSPIRRGAKRTTPQHLEDATTTTTTTAPNSAAAASPLLALLLASLYLFL